MPRTRRRCLERLLAGLVVVVAGAGCQIGAGAAMPALSCSLSAPATVAAGQPLSLRFTLHTGQALQLLVWGTPFEANWFAPFVTVQRDGVPLAYGGAAMKRGDPVAANYLRFDAGQTRSASIDLAPAFDLRQPGHYRVQPQIVLHDVADGAAAVPRPRDQHVGVALACNAVEFDVTR